jgi:GTPase SAR1 family protein
MTRPPRSHRITEADIENSVVWPLLSGIEYLSIPPEQIASKKFIPPRDIGKGASFVRGFAPDYLVYANRLPAMAVEAKPPNEPAELAYAQARLYAAEINSAYRTGINPIHWILGTNGTTVLFGPWDAQPLVAWVIGVGGIQPGRETLTMVENAGWPALQALSARHSNLLQRERHSSPVYLFGGQARLNRRLGQNSLSDVMAPLIRRYFDTDSPEEKDEILEKAYVDSELTTRYARTFENFLRDKNVPIYAPSVKPLEPTKKSEKHFTEALNEYSQFLPPSGSIQLLIGDVGVGKSFFIERFEKYLLPPQLRPHLFWVYANFNTAPSTPALYERWICEQFVEAFKVAYYSDDPEIQLSVFAEKKREFDYTNFLIKDTDIHEYNRRLSIELSDWNRDPHVFARSAARYLIGDKRVGVVCVFDNTDRGSREQQLRLFEVAEWFKTQTRACCVVALRDETYERYKAVPPLDTFIHSNHFYIRPPRFVDVVRKRLQLALGSLSETPMRTSVTGLGHVVVPPERVAGFLDAVFRHLFASTTRKISWITEGLSGKNARSALLMFARLIYSPHIDERHFIRVGAADGQLSIPERAVLNALMKTDYLYFADDHGFVSNLFDFCDGTTTSDNFIRIEILAFLVDRRKITGDVLLEGYFQAARLCEHLGLMGYDPADVLKELNWCAARGLVTSEYAGDRTLVESDIVKAHASAFVHTTLLMNRLEFVANCALTMKMFDHELAARIGAYWSNPGEDNDISVGRKREIVRDLLAYFDYWAKRRETLFPLTRDIGVAPAIVRQGLERALAFEETRVPVGAPSGSAVKRKRPKHRRR